MRRTPQEGGSETWLFVGAAGERITVAADGHSVLHLHDPSGAALVSGSSIDDYAYARDGVYSLIVDVQADTDYALALAMLGLAPGSNVLTSPTLFSVVHPSTPDAAPLAAAAGGPQEIWRFFGARGDEVRITAQSERSIDVDLVGPHNEELAGSFGYGTTALTYTLPVTGAYSLRVPTPDPFRLDFTSEPLPPSQCGASCALLRYGESITGTVQAAAGAYPAENAWRFVGHAGDQVTVTVQADAQPLRLQAFGPAGERIGCQEDVGSDKTSLRCLLPAHGQHTVVVYGSERDSVPYTLALAARR